MVSALLSTSLEATLAAVAGVVIATGGLAAVVYTLEFSAAARRRRTLHRAQARRLPPPDSRASSVPDLSARDLARLSAYRPRARLMAGESLEPVGRRQRLRSAWREGYGGWMVACLAGSFSMATHFGAGWLIAGGGWLGAIAITLASTALMVAVCAWIGLGLISGR